MGDPLLRFGMILLAASGMGLWLGEAPTEHLPSGLSFTCAIAAGVAAAIVPMKRWRWRVFAISASFVAFWLAWWAGRREASAAFNECATACASIRDSLAAYKTEKGAFPMSLSALPQAVPGRLILRGSIWSYARTSDGYALRSSDWLVTHEATHDRVCESHK